MRQIIAVLFFLAACSPREKFVHDEEKFEPLHVQSGAERKLFSLKNTPVGNLDFLIINFYAPDCPPCIQEVPELNRLWAYTQKNPRVQFIAIGSSLSAIGEEISVDKIRLEALAMQKKLSMNYPSFVATSHQLKSWRVTAFPETFIFRSDGEAWRLHKKFISDVTFAALLNEMVSN